MNNIPGSNVAACCCSTYINYMSACFSHCGNSYLNDVTCMILLHKYISNCPVICDGSDSLPLLLLQNVVKAVEEWGGSGETLTGCLRKSRFEHPTIPPHPPCSLALITNAFLCLLVPWLLPPGLVPFHMSSTLRGLCAHGSLLQPQHFHSHYSPAGTH